MLAKSKSSRDLAHRDARRIDVELPFRIFGILLPDRVKFTLEVLEDRVVIVLPFAVRDHILGKQCARIELFPQKIDLVQEESAGEAKLESALSESFYHEKYSH